MKFSAKFEYALMALLYLKCEPDEAPVSGRVLSEELHIPHRFLEQILADMKRGGLVRSIRGYQGGYKLNLEPQSISIYDVYKVIEGNFEVWDCSAAGSEDGCRQDHNLCVISQFYADFRETLQNLMEGYTLERLCQLSGRLKREGRSQQQAITDAVSNVSSANI